MVLVAGADLPRGCKPAEPSTRGGRMKKGRASERAARTMQQFPKDVAPGPEISPEVAAPGPEISPPVALNKTTG